MPNFLDKLLVKTPAYNIFPIHDIHNKLNMPIGRNIPVKYIEMHAGEEVDVNLTQLTRFMPMVNPIFHRVNLEFIPFFVPFRLLKDFGFDGENYFNPATPDSERVPIPMISCQRLYSGIYKIHNSIWDYLRYPTFSFLIRVLTNTNNSYYRYYGATSSSGSDKSIVYNYEKFYSYEEGVKNKILVDSTADSGSEYFGFTAFIFRFPVWVVRQWLATQGLSSVEIDTMTPATGEWEAFDSPYNRIQNADLSINWDVVFEDLGKRVEELYEDYMNYLHLEFVSKYCAKDEEHLEKVSLLPWLCYSRLIYDWFINTGVTDVSSVPDYFSDLLDEIENGSSFLEALNTVGLSQSNEPDLLNFFPYCNSVGTAYYSNPSRTLWQRDYFTGSFVSAQSGDAVPIPANGTIPDLAGARKLQWFRTLNLFGGKRFIDQIFAHRGVKSSDARLDRCEVIGEKKSFRLQISDVLQTSQTSIDSVQGNFSGHGISYAGDHLLHYRAEEPGLVMVIARCRPALEYIENTPRLILKSDFYDFENPEFDNVGMQPILDKELEYHIDLSGSPIFSWTRRYAEYMTDTSEYHGDFKTSLSNWHMARSFNNGHPVFNTQFSVIKATGSDDLNRIFANPQYTNSVLMDLTFDIQVSRPLSKVVEFDF